MAHQRENSNKRHLYTYDEKEVIEDLDEAGGIKKTETKTYTWQHTDMESFPKLISINGARYDESYLKLQDAKIAEIIAADNRKPEPEKQELRRKAREERDEENALYLNLQEAFTFTLAGREVINGFPAWVLDFIPNSTFRPKSGEADFLKSMRGKIWVTEDSHQLIRLTGTLEGDASYGTGIFGSLKKGSTVTMEQADIGNGLWFPTFDVLTYKATLLVAGQHKRQRNIYSNYQPNPRTTPQAPIEIEKLP